MILGDTSRSRQGGAGTAWHDGTTGFKLQSFGFNPILATVTQTSSFFIFSPLDWPKVL